MKFKIRDLTGMTTFSRGFAEACRQDFISVMGMAPEEWEAKISAELQASFVASPPPPAATSADSSTAPANSSES